IVGFSHLDYIGGDGHGSAAIFKLTSGGSAARSFGTAGHLEVAFPGGSAQQRFAQWFPCAMTIDGRGRATITGDGSNAKGDALLSIRVTAAGKLDAGFGSGG